VDISRACGWCGGVRWRGEVECPKRAQSLILPRHARLIRVQHLQHLLVLRDTLCDQVPATALRHFGWSKSLFLLFWGPHRSLI
jgi:hypothetical protein